MRRAAGHDQREGVIGRDLRDRCMIGASSSCSGSCSSAARAAGASSVEPVSPAAARRTQRRMGLLDYYRQFEGMSEEEVNGELREQAAERRRKALTRVDTLDLSQTTWPELPHPRIVNAITFVARRGLHRYPHLPRRRAARELGRAPRRRARARDRSATAPPSCCSAATRALIEPGDELLTLWPSYPLYPMMARRAHGARRAVARAAESTRCSRRRSPNTRVIALATRTTRPASCSPTAELRALLGGLPEDVAVLLDEALRRVRRRPAGRTTRSRCSTSIRALLVFRSFSKAWGSPACAAATRSAGPGSQALLARARARPRRLRVAGRRAEALRSCARSCRSGTRADREERPRLIDALRELRLRRQPTARPTSLWLRPPGLAGGELAARLAAQSGVLRRTNGDALGDAAPRARRGPSAPRRRPRCSTRCAGARYAR